jgi:hypothetical protein
MIDVMGAFHRAAREEGHGFEAARSVRDHDVEVMM